MKLTNKHGLPDALFRAIQNDPYSKGDADMSVSDLLAPARIAVLKEKHFDELTEDAMSRVFALLGQAMHTVLERANQDGIAERRLSIVVDGISISGGMDIYRDGLLQDYKLVTWYKFREKEGVPEEYENQLNCYAEILRQNGHPVTKMEIVGVLRDWSFPESKRNPRNPNYPQAQVVIRNVPIWSSEKALEFIKGRIRLHKEAKTNLPECTSKETWGQNRCKGYCPVSEFCTQFKGPRPSRIAKGDSPTKIEITEYSGEKLGPRNVIPLKPKAKIDPFKIRRSR